MKQKIGAFFFIVGIVLIFMFWGSVQASLPIGRWLLFGFLSIGGWVLIYRGREVPENQRFRMLKKMRGKKERNSKDKT